MIMCQLFDIPKNEYLYVIHSYIYSEWKKELTEILLENKYLTDTQKLKIQLLYGGGIKRNRLMISFFYIYFPTIYYITKEGMYEEY